MADEVTIYDSDDGNVIWRGLLEVQATAYDPALIHVTYPEGVSPAEVLDDLIDGEE